MYVKSWWKLGQSISKLDDHSNDERVSKLSFSKFSPNANTCSLTLDRNIFTLAWTPMSAFAIPTGAFNSTINSTTILLFANGTRKDCNLYAQVNITTPNNTCSSIVESYSVALSDFLAWNPSLASASPCILESNLLYCAQVRPLQMANISSYCSEYAVTQPGVDCDHFMAENAIEIDWFSTWNPLVGTLCENWLPGRIKATVTQMKRISNLISNSIQLLRCGGALSTTWNC